MPVTSVGLVYYAEDPSQIVVRSIHPTSNDNEIAQDVCPCGCGGLLWNSHLDPAQTPVLLVVPVDDTRASAGWLGVPPPPPPPSPDQPADS